MDPEDLVLQARLQRLQQPVNSGPTDDELEARAKRLGVSVPSSTGYSEELYASRDDDDMVEDLLSRVNDELSLEGHKVKKSNGQQLQRHDVVDDELMVFDNEEDMNVLLKDLQQHAKAESDMARVELSKSKTGVAAIMNAKNDSDDRVDNEDDLADALIAQLMAED